ncbi:polyketide synthase [Acetobacter nitrogenifigens DSM 23921 = NBRC 105050]|uniref:Putative polyketide synthase n=1 Tax=Acetobacter nitrogenifigens DSM 23921 = NBRC 105050 TaxID=1120919 RepID=A0A511XCL5_9PROT|nr:type I polyketide synthase [Acetobacter nitrogenifigens]GBQ90267.1 polyketide synthase [Acetobacter nitrogenifigens DSM 23921 = NBRC 105050]GEN60672.1 putative polyketide synthase [Acetobacter nitrogenifigens DSM 23921 = NBRC 105050]
MSEFKAEIAVVGIGCRFPGGVDTPDALWRLLCMQVDATSEVPADRWSNKRFYDPDVGVPKKTYMHRGAFLDQKIDEMDPLFFGISPREAAIMDPQQRLLLEVVWEAFEDGGHVLARLGPKRTGVFIGTFSLDWLALCGSPLNRLLINDHFSAVAASATMLAARIAHVFDLQGPCLSIDTACSSSLVAIHQACASLLAGECDVAVAGGVNLMVAPPAAITMSKGHFLAPDGRCKSFAADADGYGRGEGCGIVILKRLEDARRDGDFIHGIIAGSGVNQDGRTLSLTMPSEDAQSSLIRAVAERAGIDLSQIGYMEAHGTGTPVGDPIEVNALGSAIGTHRPREAPLVIGSLKANIGHLEAAAGVAGLIKALLCLRYGVAPPQTNLSALNSSIPFEKLGVLVSRGGMTPLSGVSGALYAGVNSFGYGGTNAVALLRAPIDGDETFTSERRLVARPSDRFILPLSAMGEAPLKALAQSYVDLLSDGNASVEDICFSSAMHRTRLQNQAVILGRDREHLLSGLNELALGTGSRDVIVGRRQHPAEQKIVFVFSGMGAQWKGMGRQFLVGLPEVVSNRLVQVDDCFARLAGWSILDAIRESDEISRIDETVVAQPAIFFVQVALVELFRFYGIEPDAIVGHSVGEVAASYAAGALSIEDAVTVIFHRSQTQARLVGRGGMLAVGMSGEEAAERLLGDYVGRVCVAALNSSKSCTLAGDVKALDELAVSCDRSKIFNRILKVDVPYHSDLMEEIREDFEKSLLSLSPANPITPLYSTVTGALHREGDRHDARYWYANMRRPVLFQNAVQALLDDSYRVFVEIGAHPVLGALVREVAADHSVDIIPTLSRREPEETALARTVARLFMAGASLDWARLTGGSRTPLPHYPWARARFWAETEASRQDRLDGTVHPVLGMFQTESAQPSWTADVNHNYMPWLRDHTVDGIVVFPAAGFIEGALALHRQLDAANGVILEDLDICQALLLDGVAPPTLEWVFNPETRTATVSSRAGNDGEGEWVRHCGLRLLSSQPWDDSLRGQEGALDDAMHNVSVEAFYERIAKLGLSYGPAFQVVRELKVGSATAFARLVLSEPEQQRDSEYFLHPALLDGAFQTLIGAGHSISEDRVFVPTGARRIVYRGGRHAALIARSTITKRAPNRIEGDINIFAEDGALVAEIRGFVATAVPQMHALLTAGDTAGHFYRQIWIDSELSAVLAEPLNVQTCCLDMDFLDRLSRIMRGQGMTANPIDLEGPSSGHTNSPSSSRDVVLYVCSDREPDTWGGSRFLSCVNAMVRGSETGSSPRFILVTQGAVSPDQRSGEPVNVRQAAVRGFARALAAERPELAVRFVDVGVDADDAVLRQLCAELVQEDTEDDVILRPGRRAVGRLSRCDVIPDRGVTPFTADETTNGEIVGVRLAASSSGSLDRLRHERFVCPVPGPGQVQFRTLAASLNFKDVLKAMGLLPHSVVENTFHSDGLGMEASVEVLAIGEGVDNFEPGRRYVVSWPGCFSSCFTASAADIFALPIEGLGSPSEAATLPVAYVTACYALTRLARLEAGEAVLIHAGTGGVGLAAIELARGIGARVFATAGSDEKREYLRRLGCEGVWSSRTLAFADGMREKTNGRGVDVVLNSLAGEAQIESLNALAPYGRFVEIGKKDILERRGLALAPFNENLSFFSLDLDRMMVERPALIRSLLSEVASLLGSGKARPLPFRAFAPAEASEAFRFLASTKHIGKVILDYARLAGVMAAPLPRQQPSVRADATYLVTGGLSGFGLMTARWLVEQGAENLVLLGRRGADEAGFEQNWSSFGASGISVQTVAADVADENAMKEVLNDITRTMPPLRGVFHCAAVLEDALLHNLDEESVGRVMRPKAEGALVLDRLTRGLALDYFVLYSSVTTLLGNVGQAAYIGANAVLEAVAVNRWNAGEAAIAVDWGAVADVGMLTRNPAAARSLEIAGIEAVSAPHALSALPDMLKLEIPNVACAKINWNQWVKVAPGGESLARFSQVRTVLERGSANGERLVELLALPDEQRLPYVVDNVKALIAQTLHLNVSAIDERARLSELGIDSLAGVELQTAFRLEFGVEISILVLARDETIQKMSEFLLNKISVGQASRLP